MTKKESPSQSEMKFALTDFLHLISHYKKTVLAFVFFAAFCTFMLAVTRPVVYLSEATFRDKGKTNASIRTPFTDLLFSSHSLQDSETISSMKSRKMISEVISHLNVQGNATKIVSDYPTINHELGKAHDNLLSEWAYWSDYKLPVLEEVQPFLKLKNINYEGELLKSFLVEFTTPHRFVLKFDDDKKEGRLDEPLEIAGATFTLTNPYEKPIQKGDRFVVSLWPMPELSKFYAGLLTITSDPEDKTLLRLHFRHRDRDFAADFLNSLMKFHVEELLKEHETLSSLQLSYLEKREDEVGRQLEKLMQDHVDKVSKDMSESGFTSSQKELEFLANRVAANEHKLTELELELKRLQSIDCDNCLYFEPQHGMGDPAFVNQLFSEMRFLQQEAKTLQLALNERALNPEQVEPFEEFEGLSLELTRTLIMNYVSQLNEVESQEKQHRFISDKLEAPDFELSSLTALLQDPISHDRVSKATQLVIQIKDEGNRTQKEIERLQEELKLQKGFLASHIMQMADLLKLKQSALRQKVIHLQEKNLELVEQKISLLRKHLKHYVENRMRDLNQERALLNDQQQTFHAKMDIIPSRWVAEQVLNHQLARQETFLENLSSMVESKNITKNLENIRSEPIDLAFASLNPKPPRLLFYSIFGALLGFVSAAAFISAKGLVKGIPVSAENLALSGFHLSGTITPFHGDEVSSTPPLLDQDLNTLRRVAARFEGLGEGKGRSVLLLPGQGPDFSNTLAQLLAKKGQRVVKLDLTFKQKDVSTSGLLQYLEGAASFPTIQNMEGFDWISSGGTSRYTEELLLSPRFDKLLEELSQAYDWILAVSSAKIGSAESENLARTFSGTAAVLTGEKLKEVISLKDAIGSDKKLTFILFS